MSEEDSSLPAGSPWQKNLPNTALLSGQMASYHNFTQHSSPCNCGHSYGQGKLYGEIWTAFVSITKSRGVVLCEREQK